jgi:hypothetical protein
MAQRARWISCLQTHLSLMVVSTNSGLSAEDTCPMRHSVRAFLSGKMDLERFSMLTVAEADDGKQKTIKRLAA